jgi:hypothetical protein
MGDWDHLTVPEGAEVLDTCAELGLGAFLRGGGRGVEVWVDWPDGRAWVGNAASLAAFRARAGRADGGQAAQGVVLLGAVRLRARGHPEREEPTCGERGTAHVGLALHRRTRLALSRVRRRGGRGDGGLR